MLPLVDKPIIQYGVEEALAAGCDQIIIVTGRGKNAIEDHFDVSFELEQMLEERGKNDLLAIVRADLRHDPRLLRPPEGSAGTRPRRAAGAGTRRRRAFAVVLADDVIDAEDPCLKQMMRVFEKRSAR